MTINILTLFPKMFSGPFDESIIKRAQEKGLVAIKIHNLRDWAVDERGTVDDRPFGGGPGMVLKPEPIFAAVETVAAGPWPAQDQDKARQGRAATKIVLLTPQGNLFSQKKAWELSKLKNLILICGHYEGVDERVREHLADEETSIGDYVLTGGELPAMVLVDTVVRLVPGVLDKISIESDSFATGTRLIAPLQHPQYTRPEKFRGFKVPEILLSGNHEEIKKWREEQARRRTEKRRPELLLK